MSAWTSLVRFTFAVDACAAVRLIGTCSGPLSGWRGASRAIDRSGVTVLPAVDRDEHTDAGAGGDQDAAARYPGPARLVVASAPDGSGGRSDPEESGAVSFVARPSRISGSLTAMCSSSEPITT